MKKNYKSIMSLGLGLMLSTVGFSQAINESFDDITTLTASGWVMNNLSTPIGTQASWFQAGATPPFAAFGGTDYVAANYNNVAGAATISNWLITPSRTFNNGDIVTFYTRTVDAPAYADRMEVRLSVNGTSTNVGTTNTSVGDFTTVLLDINPTLITTGAGSYPNVWTQYTLTVSGLPMAMTGRLAFRYFVTNGGPTGANSDFIGIDNFVYTPAGSASPDMDITAVSHQYTIIPASQATAMPLGATVNNVGTANGTNAVLTANVFVAPNFTTPVQTTTSAATAINTGANATLTAGSYTPSAVGTYVYQYIVSCTNDANAVNDTLYHTFLVDDYAYARDNGNITGSLGIGAGAAANGILGQNFNFVNSGQVDSVMVYINGGALGNTMIGQPLRLSVYNTTTGTPTTVVATTNINTVSTVGPHWEKLTFSSPLTLTAGTYFFGAHEADSNLTIATTPAIFTAGATWVNWSTIPGGTWGNSETFGFPVSYVLRPFISCILDVTTATAGATITANASGATYQWIDCGNSNAIIAGETNQSYTATASGNYAVIVTNGACSDTSACVNVTVTGINEATATANISLYPNPNTGSFVITSSEHGKYVIYNELGQEVRSFELNQKNNYSISVSDLSNGVYMLTGYTNNKVVNQKIIVNK